MLSQECTNNNDGGDLKKKKSVNAKAFVYSNEISNITEVSMLDNYETWDLCTAKSKKDPKTGQT